MPLAPRGSRVFGLLLLTGAISLLALLAASCSKSSIEKALSGELNPADSNRAVNNYCQGCHVHAELEPDKHMASMLRLFKETKLAQAQECRECHIIKLEGIFAGAERHTLRPEVLKGETPAASERGSPEPSSPPEEPSKKKRRWYFLYLF